MSNIKKKSSATNMDNFKESLTTYFKGVKSEWGKVTWPERRQVVTETFVVIGVVLFFSILVYLLDKVFSLIFSPLARLS